MRLALAATHPIQYQAPWFRALAARPEIELEVGFAWLPDATAQGVGFDVPFEWDVPVLEGYRWVELERSSSRPRLSTFNGLKLRRPGRWLAGRDALIVTGWHSRALVQLTLAARRRRLPVLVRGDSHAGRRRPRTVRLMHRAWLRLFDAFLVVGSGNRAFYRQAGIAERRLFDCPHFVDNARFAAGSDSARQRRDELRTAHGISAGAVCALFVGKLEPVKSLGFLLDAVERARPRAPGLELAVVGEGPLRRELELRARAAGMPVVWSGFVNQRELPERYAAADFLVLPSRSETWGLVVNEAMACGLPALVSDTVGCAPDLVREGETGWVIAANDPDALATGLVRAWETRDRLPAMGAAARGRVLADFSVERAVEGTLAALAAVGSRR